MSPAGPLAANGEPQKARRVHSEVWLDRKGLELIRVTERSTLAELIPARVTADQLDDLAEACTEAAAQMRGEA